VASYSSVQPLVYRCGLCWPPVVQVLRAGHSRGAFLVSQLELRPGSAEEELFRELPVFGLERGVAGAAESAPYAWRWAALQAGYMPNEFLSLSGSQAVPHGVP